MDRSRREDRVRSEAGEEKRGEAKEHERRRYELSIESDGGYEPAALSAPWPRARAVGAARAG